MVNPYDDEVLFNLCEVTRGSVGTNGLDTSAPQPNYGKILFAFPPAGPVNVKRQANYSEKENKSSGATIVEDKKIDKPVEISFQIDLLTDDEPDENGNQFSALEKAKAIEAIFLSRDSSGRRIIYAPQYPEVAEDVQFVFVAALDFNDTLEADLISMRITLRQWMYNPPKKTGGGSGSGASDSDENVIDGNIDAYWDAMQDAIEKKVEAEMQADPATRNSEVLMNIKTSFGAF
jgi:hypothetical protein